MVTRVGDRIGYARVSTVEQSLDLQTDALAAAGCVKTFSDTTSGAKASRPGLDQCLAELRPGDVLTVWRIDRLGRSLPHIVQLVADLATRKVQFSSLTEGIDTTTVGGEFVFHIFAALAQMERRLISERTVAGMAAAAARGKVAGRPPALSAEQIDAARQLEAAGTSQRVIASTLRVSPATISRVLRKPGNATALCR